MSLGCQDNYVINNESDKKKDFLENIERKLKRVVVVSRKLWYAGFSAEIDVTNLKIFFMTNLFMAYDVVNFVEEKKSEKFWKPWFLGWLDW